MALREIGYLDGQNIAIESRTTEETVPQLAPLVEELVRPPVDILATAGTPAATLAKAATRTIPILFFGVGDAVAFGLVARVARPEGNVTRVTNFAPQVIARGLEFLVQLAPGVARVAFVGNLGGNPGSPLQLAAAQMAAATIGVQIVAFELRDAGDIDRVFDSLFAKGVKAVLVGSDAITINNQPRLVALAARYRLPAMYSKRVFADAGGLIAYGSNYPALWDRLAALIDKVVRGKTPGELPVEQPTKFDLVPNLRTAEALGMTFPPAILALATDVIR